MSRLPGGKRLLRQLLNLWLRLWVRRIQAIPSASLTTVARLAVGQRIIYLLPYRSEIDLLTLQRYCLKQHLPDPLETDKVNGEIYHRCLFLNEASQLSLKSSMEAQRLKWLQKAVNINNDPNDKEVYLVLVSLFWGRLPGYGMISPQSVSDKPLNTWQKVWQVFSYGRDLFIDLASPVSLSSLLSKRVDKPKRLQALVRLARVKLAHSYRIATGSMLISRSRQLRYHLQSPTLQATIVAEVQSKQKAKSLIEKQVLTMFDEMASDYSYGLIRWADRLFSWLWYCLYQGIEVNHFEPVRQLALSGYELVYLPCHRSHIDYLLLSYVLYHQGLAPPYVAGGINLNFWPVGGLLRRMGAFFIRRSFRGNKLYTCVLQEYLAYLLVHGFSVGFFIEGGRSRTGRLLSPKTGLLSMTLQTALNDLSRPVALIPIYLGYEHVLEVQTYTQELSGKAKKPENTWRLLTMLPLLRKLGHCTVNFGQPLLLDRHFDRQWSDWRSKTRVGTPYRIKDSPMLVNELVQQLMEHINSAAAVNAVNLCFSVLLVAEQHQLPQSQLIEQMEGYRMLWKNAPYSASCTLPEVPTKLLLEQVLKLGKIHLLKSKQADPQVILPEQQVVIADYYCNNIEHLLILPSLVANLVLNHPGIEESSMVNEIESIYPILQADLFINYTNPSLAQRVTQITQELSRQQWIYCLDSGYQGNQQYIRQLQLLAAQAQPLLKRYWLLRKLLLRYQHWNRQTIEECFTRLLKTSSVTGKNRVCRVFDKGSTVITVLQQSSETLLQGLEKLLPSQEISAGLQLFDEVVSGE